MSGKHKLSCEDRLHQSHKTKKISRDENCLFKTCLKYKYELNYVLQNKRLLNPNSLNDFWNFFERYENIQKRLDTRYDHIDKTNVLCIKTKEKLDSLYENLPMFDRNSDKVRLNLKEFEQFIKVLLFYKDFKQKEKFNNLKKLRRDQRQLPIADYRKEIIESIHENNVVLIAGDTGCGKSTQVPQYILKAGFNKIACTQPRRLACIALAKRVAQETLTENTTTIGYQIRFEKTKRKDTKIIFITEGLLLRQAADEELLTSYDVVILDEVHERHLYGDFLVGIMKCLLYKHTKFKLVLMSATVNIELYKEYFSNEGIKVVQVPGRLYPIEIIYKPIIVDKYDQKQKRQSEKLDSSPYIQILQLIEDKYPYTERGDALVFLSGISQINTLAEHIREYDEGKNKWIILKLHSSLSLAEQDKVFQCAPEGVRKCILSTNIAETSVTIDGIRFVIDSGKVNRMTYSTQNSIHKLKEQSISQDSAKQRSGRAGRTGPGICFRLYSESQFEQWERFTLAEIHSVSLEMLILQMVSMGLSDVVNFPFLEKPDADSVKSSIEKLVFHGALMQNNDDDGGNVLSLSVLGEALAKLPVDLTVGKMLVSATVLGRLAPLVCLAAVLSVQSPYTNDAYRNLDYQQAREPYESNYGDPLTLLNLFKEWLNLKVNSGPLQHSNRNKYRDTNRPENPRHWARSRGLEEQRFYEIVKLSAQFKEILKDSNLIDKDDESDLSNSSSMERTLRHGELKQLRSMRRRLANDERSSAKKTLKNSFGDEADDDEEICPALELRDIDFRIQNSNLQNLLSALSKSTSDTTLRILLCAGFYPQVASPDELNHCKPPTEQFYHTKYNNYTSLHPTSYLCYHPEMIYVKPDQCEPAPQGYQPSNKYPLSRKHQLIVYQSVLETNKVYLVNTVRVPALQTLVLFGHQICTNSTITKIAVDDFLLVEAPYVGQAKNLLIQAIKIRRTWDCLLTKKICGDSFSISAPTDAAFLKDLHRFMSIEIIYNIRRLLNADRKILYKLVTDENDVKDLEKFNIFEKDFTAKPESGVGGVRVNDHVVFNCLVEDKWDYEIAEEVALQGFDCVKCGQHVYGTFLQQAVHEDLCST